MRRRRIRDSQFGEPSLVPMADLLSNTVGAVVFILIFTVLAAGGVVILKRLPLEHSTKAKPLNFYCVNGRIIPLDNSGLSKKLNEKWGRPYSIFAVRSWFNSFNNLEVEDEYFIARGESKMISGTPDLSILFIPKEGKGETKEELGREDSEFRKLLAEKNSEDYFVHFLVKPDSLDIFYKAREIASEKMKYGSGWSPVGQDDRLRFGSYGRESKEQ